MPSLKKVMVRCDMEGVSGVVNYDQVTPGRPDYAFGQRMFMHDLLALLDGLQAGGVDEVVLYDEHKTGCNIDLERLPACVTSICGKPPYRANWPGGLDDTFDGMILLGLHAKAASVGALMPHTYEHVIADLRLNAVSLGEIGLEAAIAADCGVPTLLVVADSARAAEAERLLPGVPTVAVKESLWESGAACLPLAVTAQRIHDAARTIATSPPPVELLSVHSPARLEIELHAGRYLDAFARLFATPMLDERTVMIEGPNTLTVWAQYWQMKLKVQATL
jgi:D-amino peptidase